MKITRGVTAVVVFAGLAVGFASPAWADEFSGTYNVSYGQNSATWTVTPCNPQPFIPCAQVAEAGSPLAPWQAEADLSVGYWAFSVERPDVLECADGAKHPATATYSVDAATLEGHISIFDDKVCSDKARTLYAPITVTKTG